jgi:hypothetical protein
MNPQIREVEGQWIIESYEDLRFSSESGAQQYYMLHLLEDKK